MESNIVNHLETQNGPFIWQSADVHQKWQTAAMTCIMLLVAYYIWPQIAYETTIQRTIYEMYRSLVPDRLIPVFNKVVSDAAVLLNLPGIDRGIGKPSQYSSFAGPSLSSVAQRARALSGLEKTGLAGQELTFPGMGNWDNSCFQNSVLQGLASLTEFSEYVQKGVLKGKDSNVQIATYEGLDEFLSKLQQGQNSRETVWPPSVLRSMNTWQQQDAQEYYSKVIEALEKEDKKLYTSTAKEALLGLECLRPHLQMASADNSMSVDESFSRMPPTNPLEGAMSQMLRCQSCQHSDGMSIMPFTSLTLNLGLGGNCYLEDLLDTHTDPELIDGVECDHCTKLAQRDKGENMERKEDEAGTPKRISKVLSTKSKRILFSRLPQNLVIHLNRSIYDEWGNQRKNTALVHFPARLEIIADWVAQLEQEPSEVQTVYELRCIVTHQGRHDNGHYVACGKRGKGWYSFNDELVTRTGEEDVLRRGNVFMLFYAKLEQPVIMEFPVEFSDCQEDKNAKSADADGVRTTSGSEAIQQSEAASIQNAT